MITEDEEKVGVNSIVNGIVDLLNEALKADPKTMQALICHRIKCNDALADHPDIQVNMDSEVGILGIINGICLRTAGEKICITVDDTDGTVTGFTRFCPMIHELRK
jgi:hypothetical protein